MHGEHVPVRHDWWDPLTLPGLIGLGRPGPRFITEATRMLCVGSGLSSLLSMTRLRRCAILNEKEPFHPYFARAKALPASIPVLNDFLEMVRRSDNRKWRRFFNLADVIVISIDSNEYWVDSEEIAVLAGETCADGVGLSARRQGVSQTVSALRKLSRLLARLAPNAKLVLAIDPAPAALIGRTLPMVEASGASKAILRAAIDEVLVKDEPPPFHYFPALELSSELFADRFGEDGRLINRIVAEQLVAIFYGFFGQEQDALEISRSLLVARMRNLEVARASARAMVGTANDLP